MLVSVPGMPIGFSARKNCLGETMLDPSIMHLRSLTGLDNAKKRGLHVVTKQLTFFTTPWLNTWLILAGYLLDTWLTIALYLLNNCSKLFL